MHPGATRPGARAATRQGSEKNTDDGDHRGTPEPILPLSTDGQAGPRGSRWARRMSDSPSGAGWKTVTRKTRDRYEFLLSDEWSVPVRTKLCLHQAGILLEEDVSQARACCAQMTDTQAPSAILSRSRHEGLPDAVSIHKVAFHLRKRTHSEHQDDQDNAKEVLIPVVGWIHQLCNAHKVNLRRAPQVAAIESKGGTCVIKLVATAQWTPPEIWRLLQKGRVHAMKEKAEELLREKSVKHMQDLYDVFHPQMQGRLVTCSVRIANGALQPLLSVSGASWLFVHPVGPSNADYPTIWTGTSWPQELAPLYDRVKDIGGIGLSLGERHVGFRVKALHEQAARDALDAPTLRASLR